MDQTPRPDGSRGDRQDHQRDLNTEFVALTGNMDIPDNLSVEDLGAVQEVDNEPGRQTPMEDSSVLAGSAGESKPADTRPDDAPHNTYRPLNGGDETTGDSDRSRLTDTQEAQIAAVAEPLNSYMPDQSEDQAPRVVKVATVVTPLNRADGPVGMCSLLDPDRTVVPSPSRAFVVKQSVSAHSNWDVVELFGGSDSEPAEAMELTTQLSHPSRAGTVLITTDLATDVGIEFSLSGTITARHFINGQLGEGTSAELLLASMDQVVESVLLGVVDAGNVSGAVKPSRIQAPWAVRWFGRGLHRPS